MNQDIEDLIVKTRGLKDEVDKRVCGRSSLVPKQHAEANCGTTETFDKANVLRTCHGEHT